jgi:U3 small nucleolar RNA-associated protein 21
MIREIVTSKDNVFTIQSNNTVLKWKRMHVESVIKFEDEISNLMVFGDQLILSARNKNG